MLLALIPSIRRLGDGMLNAVLMTPQMPHSGCSYGACRFASGVCRFASGACFSRQVDDIYAWVGIYEPVFLFFSFLFPSHL